METAKVDIRKLQLLNDRINQCIDALAQVRLSVHGLQHSNPIGQMGFGIGSNPFGQSSFGNPLAQQGGGLYGQQQGIQGQGIQGMQNPWPSQQSFGQQGGQGGFGLSHTSPDVLEYSRPTWADPGFASRVYQTFPYAQLQMPPVVSLY